MTFHNAMTKELYKIKDVQAKISICKAWLFYNQYASFKKDK